MFIFPLCGFAEWDAIVVNVVDGDTLVVSEDGLAKIVRLYGIDCPEQGQPFGSRARDFTRHMVSGKRIRVFPIDASRYIESKVYVQDKCLNEELLKAGYAWTGEDLSDRKWERLEQQARAHKEGLWSNEDPVAPWEFRAHRDDSRDEVVREIHTIKWGGKHRMAVQAPRRPNVRSRYRRR